jgi:hypothetical protein
MLTFHPYGAGISFFSFNYKHFVPDGTFHRCAEFISRHSSAPVFPFHLPRAALLV